MEKLSEAAPGSETVLRLEKLPEIGIPERIKQSQVSPSLSVSTQGVELASLDRGLGLERISTVSPVEPTFMPYPLRWYEPTILLSYLTSVEKMGEEPSMMSDSMVLQASQWSVRVRESISKLGMTFPQDASDSVERYTTLAVQQERREILESLSGEYQISEKILRNMSDHRIVTCLGRAHFALQRRMIAWKYCSVCMENPLVNQKITSEEWFNVLTRVYELTVNHPYGRSWYDYLDISNLVKLPEMNNLFLQRRLAQQVLLRIHSRDLNESQRVFLTQAPVNDLSSLLSRVATQVTGDDYFLRSLELYESGDSASAAMDVGSEMLRAQFSGISARVEALSGLEQHYRNANIRLAISHDFMSRMMPGRGCEVITVRDRVLDLPVYGSSTITTDVNIRMVPDSSRFRMAFLVNGNVESRTQSHDRGVTVTSDARANYTAIKEVEFSAHGVRTEPARANVEQRIQLSNLETSVDHVPVLGLLVGGVARSQALSKQPLAKLEVEEKIRREVQQRLDSEVDEKMRSLNELWGDKLMGTLSRFSLDLQDVDAITTEQHAVARLRVAGHSQLGGHTPRPLAPEESIFNFQVHESAFNNFLQHLELDGKTFTVPQLREYLKSKVVALQKSEEMDSELGAEVTIKFAARDSVMVHMNKGKFEVCLSLDEMRAEGKTWRNFKICVPFTLNVQGCQIFMNRGGVISVRGKLNFKSQIAVRGIFCKAFLKDQERPLMPAAFLNDPRLSSLSVNQCILQDGWLGISITDSSRTPSILTQTTGNTIFR